jgi:hypothetical protein
MKTLDEFKQAGGALTGGKHTTHEEYEGAPRPYNDKLATTFEKLEERFPDHHGSHLKHGTTGITGTTGTTGITGSTGTGLVDSTKTHRPTDSGVAGMGNDNYNNGTSLGSRGAGPLGTVESEESRHKKPSLLDRLNPRRDADGDGKKGLMD